jgi:hypothetical protein
MENTSSYCTCAVILYGPACPLEECQYVDCFEPSSPSWCCRAALRLVRHLALANLNIWGTKRTGFVMSRNSKNMADVCNVQFEFLTKFRLCKIQASGCDKSSPALSHPSSAARMGD